MTGSSSRAPAFKWPVGGAEVSKGAVPKAELEDRDELIAGGVDGETVREAASPVAELLGTNGGQMY